VNGGRFFVVNINFLVAKSGWFFDGKVAGYSINNNTRSHVINGSHIVEKTRHH
jgi:hypothetical protein